MYFFSEKKSIVVLDGFLRIEDFFLDEGFITNCSLQAFFTSGYEKSVHLSFYVKSWVSPMVFSHTIRPFSWVHKQEVPSSRL